MKNKFIMLLSAAFMSISAYAQKISADKVPLEVTKAFKAKFPEAKDTDWEMESTGEYEADFKLNRVEQSATFDQNGKWMETETEIKVSELPAAVQAALKNQFADFKTGEAGRNESVKNEKCYEVEIERGKESYEVLFNEKGEVLSKKAEEENEKDKD